MFVFLRHSTCDKFIRYFETIMLRFSPGHALVLLCMVLAAVSAQPRACRADSFTALSSFVGPSDGEEPWAGQIQANDGNLYGTTNRGGLYNQGAIYKITLSGAYTTLYSFRGTDGA